MIEQNFKYSFTTSKSANEAFAFLLDPNNWWVGLYGEKIKGNSKNLNDEYTYHAGAGVHYSNQKLIEVDADKKIVWLVTDSNLSFLKNTNEWTETKICFYIERNGNSTTITFTHIGLIPQIECYGDCSNGWTKYLENLQAHLSK